LNAALALGMKAMERIKTLEKTPGPAGEPGLGFDDLVVEYDDERTFTFKMARGDLRKEFSFKMPVMLYRGVFSEDKAKEKAYDKGDTVTWAGSTWTAETETSKKPGEEKSGWRLVVKKGRDGTDREVAPKKDAVSVPLTVRGR
jgi:integrin beta 3